jgi:predicted O-linked N-acetylglucosamine transferase (SPINDLY family)
VRKLSDAELAERVRSEKIDILIDLSGHAGVNRLLVFARKPAPVQVTYLGYPDTTGMSAMDYRITDDNADPAGMTERFHTEPLIRLPGSFFCYRPAEELPDVASPPCEVTGQVTFGSFNNLAKVSADVIALWARVLDEVPLSRLMIKSLALNDEPTRRRIRRAFAAHGIDSRRLDLRGREVTYRQHLAMYAGVDVALDTFPYHGTTTTCEALAMGVPVVTLAGRTHASRVGVSILTHAWLEDWIAKDADEYIFKAVSLASDPARLKELRRVLREQLFNSSLGDANALARHLEESYREMWSKWCAGGAGKVDAPEAHTA